MASLPRHGRRIVKLSLTIPDVGSVTVYQGLDMMQSHVVESAGTSKTKGPFSRQLPGFYRAIGLAAVAQGLELRLDAFEPGLQEVIKRGARQLSSQRS
jgi:hypothetical protein